MLHVGKFLTWNMKLESYFLYLDENILLLVAYGPIHAMQLSNNNKSLIYALATSTNNFAI